MVLFRILFGVFYGRLYDFYTNAFSYTLSLFTFLFGFRPTLIQKHTNYALNGQSFV